MTGAPGWIPGRISVVVPTRDSARTLRRCLESVAAQTHGDVELIVVDNGSTDETTYIASEFADRVERWGPERSAQRNHGLRLSSGEFVLFLDSDLALAPEAAAQGAALFAEDDRLGAIVVPELASGDGFLASCRALEKRLYLGDEDVEAARLFRRSALLAHGGYHEAITGGEDWELPDRIETAGWKVGRLTAHAWHDEGRVRLRAAFRKKRYYGRGFSRYLRVRPRGRRRKLLRLGALARLPRLATRPHHAIGLIVLKAVECLGLAVGVVEGRVRERRRLARSWRPRARDSLIGYGLPVAAALGATLLGFRPGAFVAAGDVTPFVRESLARELFAPWSHQLTGAGSSSYEIARALEVVPLRLAELIGASEPVAQLLLFASCSAFAAFGTAYLAGAFVRHPAALAAAGLVGAFNAFALVNHPNPLPLLAQGLLGVLVGQLWRHAQRRRVSALAVAATTVPASYLAVNPPLLVLLFATTVAAGALASVVVGRGGSHRALLLLARAGPLALLLNAWWIVPFAQVTLGGAGTAFAAETDVQAWAWSHVRNSLANVASLNAHWGWSHPEYYPYASGLEEGIWPILRWLLPIGAAVGVVLAAPGRRRGAWTLAVAAAVLIFLGKGLHEPFSGSNLWLYENLPGYWLFREPVSKLGVVLVLVYALLLAVAGERLLQLMRPRALGLRLAGAGALALALAGVVAYPWPLWTGAVVPEERGSLPGAHVRVPGEWRAAADAVNHSPVRGKALVLPLSSYYQVTSDWGYHGADAVPGQLLHRPAVQRLRGGYFDSAAGFDTLVREAEDAALADDPATLARILQALGVSHIILRHDLVPDEQNGEYASTGELRREFEEGTWLRRLFASDTVDVFEVKGAPGAVRAYGRLVGVAGWDSGRMGTSVGGLPRDAISTATLALAVDAAMWTVAEREGASSFRLARPGLYEIARRHAGGTVYRAVLDPDPSAPALVLGDSARLALDGVRVPLGPSLRLPLADDDIRALAVGGRLQPFSGDSALVVVEPFARIEAYGPAEGTSARGRFSPLEDCNAHDGRTAVEAGLSLSRVGPRAIRLAARAHSACTWVSLRGGSPAEPYEVRLRYLVQRGAPARICVWQEGLNRCAELPPLPQARGERSYRAVFRPSPGAAGLRLYLYADGGVRGGTVVEYRDVTVRPLRLLGSATAATTGPEGERRYLAAGSHRLAFRQDPLAGPLGPLSEIEDCGASDARTPAEARLRLERLPGGIIQLSARAHIACAWAPAGEVLAGSLYQVAFDYRTLSGRAARVCVWQVGVQDCANLPSLSEGSSWDRFRAVFRLDERARGVRLYLYADGQAAPGTQVQYRNLVLEPVAPEIVQVASLSSAASPPELEWFEERPDHYRVRVSGADGSFVLALTESYAPGWSLEGLPADWSAEHVEVDGYANGWRIRGSGNASLTLVYAPGQLARAGTAISLLAGLVLAAFILLRFVLRRR